MSNLFKYIIVLTPILILLFLYEMVISGKTPLAPDYLSHYPTKKWGENYLQSQGEMPQWYPFLFSGSPSYSSYTFTPSDPVANVFRHNVFNLGFTYWFYFSLAGIGMYLFLRCRNFSLIPSVYGAVIFSLTPYFFGLINAGHGTKIFTLSYLPWVMVAADAVLKKSVWRGIFYVGLVTALQLWAKHPQIVYYTWMMVIFLWLWRQVGDLILKNWSFKSNGVRSVILFTGLIIGLLTVIDPYVSIFQFQKQSNRGAQSVLEKATETESGTRWDYATRWSMHPKETISFIYPYFYGLQNYPTRDLKSMAYWGHMPFTQSTHYMGLLTIIIAVIGLIVKKPDNNIWSFIILTGLILLVGFGNYFPVLFWPLFKFAPFFSKFRVPSMIYAVLPFTVGYLASSGLENIIKLLDNSSKPDFQKLKNWGFGLFGLIIGLSLLFLLIGRGFSHISGFFSHPADVSKIRPELLTQLKEVRIEIFQKGLLLALMSSLLGLSALWLGMNKYIKSTTFGVVILMVTIFDLWVVDHEFLTLKPSRNLSQHFRRNSVVNYLKQDKSLFRIFPLDNFNTNWYGYFGLSSVGGYRAVKLRTYQDLMDAGGMNNPSILNMLNVKYLITKREIKLPNFENVFSDGQNIYRNLSVLPKAWIVSKIIGVETQKESLNKTMVSEFNPAVEAVVLHYDGPEFEKDGSGTVIVNKYSENEIVLQSTSQTGGLLVLSENYYRPGWKAIVDDNPAKIYQTNHILRSVFVPDGEHTIIFRYDDKLFKISRLISRLFLSSLIIGIIYFHRGNIISLINKIRQR